MNLVQKNELGPDQWIWLKKFKSINLDEWRLIIQKNKVDDSKNVPIWMYIGKTDLDNYNSIERNNNLLLDKYYYWPN